jgi:hypothetical protein
MAGWIGWFFALIVYIGWSFSLLDGGLPGLMAECARVVAYACPPR